jgi:hypothetical protein
VFSFRESLSQRTESLQEESSMPRLRITNPLPFAVVVTHNNGETQIPAGQQVVLGNYNDVRVNLFAKPSGTKMYKASDGRAQAMNAQIGDVDLTMALTDENNPKLEFR